ncbi:MAG: GNAT family N-acetyltransferase [Nanoarchaeota archaeon]|nr:GNAT family N-acetyltransferase [Nanoarchaeota archaeon]
MTLVVKLSETYSQVLETLKLRTNAFSTGEKFDTDEFDQYCDHLMVEEDGKLVGSIRLRQKEYMKEKPLYLESKFEIKETYLEKMGSLLEMGRLCSIENGNPKIPIAILSGTAEYGLSRGIKNLIGCISFHRTGAHEINNIYYSIKNGGWVEENEKPVLPLPNFQLSGFNPNYISDVNFKYEALAKLYFQLGSKIVSYPALYSSLHCVDFLSVASLNDSFSKFDKFNKRFVNDTTISKKIKENTLVPIWKR